MNNEDLAREVKHLRGLAEVLVEIANEVESSGEFTEGQQEILKRLGSNVLFKGVSLPYLEARKDAYKHAHPSSRRCP